MCYCDCHSRNRKKLKTRFGNLLVFVDFEGLLLIVAAAFMSSFLHAAGSAFAVAFSRQIPAHQLTHAIMHVHRSSAGNGEIYKGCYGY